MAPKHRSSTHPPPKIPPISQVPLHPDAPLQMDTPSHAPAAFRTFFSLENPLWVLLPLILSVAALWFAYKSNVISREWADAHLRITLHAFRSWPDYDASYMLDGDVYIPGGLGSLDNIEELMDEVIIANNDIGMRWLALSTGMDPDEIDIEEMPYVQYFVFLSIANDGDQIAQDFYVTCDAYIVDDPKAFRGDQLEQEGVEPEEWSFGPSVIAPDRYVMIPLVACFFRLDPASDENEILYYGDAYVPRELRYTTAISGEHVIPLDMDNIPSVMNAFTKPAMPAEDKDNDLEEEGTTGDEASDKSNRP